MVVNLIRREEGAEVIPWVPASLDLLATARHELRKENEPRKPKPPLNPDSARAMAEHIHQQDSLSEQSFSSLRQQKKEEASVQKIGIPLEELEALQEESRQEGYKTGYEEGFAQGKEEGYQAGHTEGNQAGHEEGCQKGYTEGLEKGAAEGQTQGHREGFDEGHDAGYAAGVKEGADQASDYARKMDQLWRQFKGNIEEADQQLAEDMLGLALDIANQIVMTAVEVQPELLLPVIRQAMLTLPQAASGTRILIHPKDASMVEQFLTGQGMMANCTVVPDDSITSGGCKIENDSALVDATIQHRRERVLSGMGVYRDWIEKRKWTS